MKDNMHQNRLFRLELRVKLKYTVEVGSQINTPIYFLKCSYFAYFSSQLHHYQSKWFQATQHHFKELRWTRAHQQKICTFTDIHGTLILLNGMKWRNWGSGSVFPKYVYTSQLVNKRENTLENVDRNTYPSSHLEAEGHTRWNFAQQPKPGSPIPNITLKSSFTVIYSSVFYQRPNPTPSHSKHSYSVPFSSNNGGTMVIWHAPNALYPEGCWICLQELAAVAYSGSISHAMLFPGGLRNWGAPFPSH